MKSPFESRGSVIADADPGSAPAVIEISHRLATYRGPILNLDAHRNGATTLAIGIDGRFRFRDSLGETRSCTLAIIPAGYHHQILAETARRMVFVYFDPQRAKHLPTETQLLAHFSSGKDPASFGLPDWARLCLAQHPQTRPFDPRITQTLETLRTYVNAFPHADAAAKACGLSPSQFHALFRRHVGVPFRRHRVWQRFLLAANIIARGGNLTEAAYEAGFASSAHFSSSFRAMFGLAPSGLLTRQTRLSVFPDDAI
jgi:AraC-like DNA-binding protein